MKNVLDLIAPEHREEFLAECERRKQAENQMKTKSILTESEINDVLSQLPPDALQTLAEIGMALNARRMGQATSPRKAAASRENGKKGGRPKKAK